MRGGEAPPPVRAANSLASPAGAAYRFDMRPPRAIRRRIRGGFTLVEIIILLLIIALLLVMAIPAFQKIREAKQERANQQSQESAAASAARP